MTAGRLIRLCKKELRETLRDRRTMLTLVVMPLIVYPILSLTLQRFMLTAAPGHANVYLVGVASQREQAWLDEVVSRGRHDLEQRRPGSTDDDPQFQAAVRADLEEGLMRGELDVIVDVQPGPPADVRLTTVAGSSMGRAAKSLLIRYFDAASLALLRQQLEEQRGFAEVPIRVEQATVGAVEETPMLATVVPLVLVLMTITGAVYPAIDLTAGERERGTMEALMAAPVPRTSLLFAKYVAVVTVALLTATANLVAMFVTLQVGGFMEMLFGTSQMPWLQLLQVLGLLVLFSCFFSAVLLALTSFARSFKEAQAYLIPIMLLALAPGVLSLLPGIELRGLLMVTPLINIVLLARDLLIGGTQAVVVVTVVLTTLLYAGAALSIAASLFGSDAVLAGSTGSLHSGLMRPRRGLPVPAISQVATCLACIFPFYFLIASSVKRIEDISLVVRLPLLAAVTALLFGGMPWAFATYRRNDLTRTFALTRFSLWMVPAAALLGGGLWAAAHELILFANQMGIGGISEAQLERVGAVAEQFRMIPLWVLLGSFALVPAIFEELCFRGYVFGAFHATGSPRRAIVVSSLLFGLFHVLVGDALAIERFLPTTMMGLALGYIRWRSGSVFPGMLLHVVHNGLLLSVAYYTPQLHEFGIGVEEGTHLPLTWHAVCLTLVVSGAAIAWFAGARASQPVSADA